MQLRNLIVDASRNGESWSLYPLAFGDGADLDLLQGLAADNGGESRRIYTDADAASQLTSFYDEIAAPILSDIKVKYSVDVESTRNEFATLFKGSELVVAGKIVDARGLEFVDVTISAKSASGPVTFESRFEVLPLDASEPALLYVEKIWAFLEIKDLLVESRKQQLAIANRANAAAADKAPPTNAAKEASIELALKYGFVTPYTSLIVVAESKTGEHMDGDADSNGRLAVDRAAGGSFADVGARADAASSARIVWSTVTMLVAMIVLTFSN